MKEKPERKTPRDVKFANIVAIVTIVTYSVLRFLEGIVRPEYRQSSYIVMEITAVLVLLLIFCMYRLRGHPALAFIVAPLALITFTIGAYITRDFEYFYLCIVAIAGIACFYRNRKSLIFFLVIDIAVNAALLIFFFPRWEFTNIAQMHVGLAISSVIIIYMLYLTYTALAKAGKADNALVAFESLLQSTPNYTVIADEADIVRYISKPMSDFASISEQSLAIERPLLDLFGDVDVKMMFGDILDASDHFEDTREMTIDGEKRYFKVISSRLEGDWDGVFIDITDITPTVIARKNAESAKLDAEAANASKSSFLAKMSHEIRTPMNAIMGMSELLLRHELPQEARDNAHMIKSASANLLSIINDILDFSKIESGMLEIIEVGYMFPSLMNDVINIIRMRLFEKPIQFVTYIDPDIPTDLLGDEIRLRQILTNILSNAVKYTNEGFISLSVTGERSDDTVVLKFEVADSGIGIKESDIGKLFGDFVQFDAVKNRGVEGTGLGLAITRNLSVLMGGDITVSSEYGSGSVFTVTIPQKYVEYEPMAKVEKPEEKSILLYETRDLHRESLLKTFEKLGVSCYNAGSIPELFDHITEYEYIFISSFMYGSVQPTLQDDSATLVLLADVTETLAPKDATMLALPAHSLSVANVLNGIKSVSSATNVVGASFTAPEAKVMIVDDVMANLMVAEGLMSPYEMQITLCSSGAEALTRIKERRYDLVFMDHMMPEMDGIEVTGRIRAMEGEYFQNLPIVALTANAVAGVREMFVQNGMNDFLAKPIETAKLDAILDRWIPKDKRQALEEPAEDETEPVFTVPEQTAPVQTVPTQTAPTQTPPVSAAVRLIDLLRTVPELSTEKALAVVGGSEAQYEKIVTLTAQLLPENIEKLAALLDKDWGRYCIEVHGVKGVLNNMGAYELGKEAFALETLSRNGDFDECLELHPPFMEKITRFQETLQNIIDGMVKPDKPQGDLSKLGEVLPELERATEFFDCALALEILSGIEDLSFGGEYDEMLGNLTNAFDRFDFDEAGEFIKKMKGRLL